MILASKLVLGILTDGAKLVIHVHDGALDVGDRHDGVLVQGKLLIGQFLERTPELVARLALQRPRLASAR